MKQSTYIVLALVLIVAILGGINAFIILSVPSSIIGVAIGLCTAASFWMGYYLRG
mgnify:CR=1 FL=1